VPPQEVRVPVFLTGLVTRLDGFDFCMDGATYGLRTHQGPARLKPTNEETQGFLERVANTRLRVTVAGYPSWGAECNYVSVYYAAPSEETVKSLGISL